MAEAHKYGDVIDIHFPAVDPRADSEEIYAYVRENESDRLVILVNFTGGEAAYEPEEAGIDDNENTVLLMSNYGGTDGRIGVLRPYESVILRAAK